MTTAPGGGARRSTSLWLVPADPVRSALRATIGQLAHEHGTPPFEPHLTLVSTEADDATLDGALEAAASAHHPLQVVAGTTGHGAARFTALFVTLDDPRLHALAADVAARLDAPFDAGAFQPHVSLLYREDLAPDVRAALAAQHVLEGAAITFDTLVAMRPPTDPEDVAGWDTSRRRTLSGGR